MDRRDFVATAAAGAAATGAGEVGEAAGATAGSAVGVVLATLGAGCAASDRPSRSACSRWSASR